MKHLENQLAENQVFMNVSQNYFILAYLIDLILSKYNLFTMYPNFEIIHG